MNARGRLQSVRRPPTANDSKDARLRRRRSLVGDCDRPRRSCFPGAGDGLEAVGSGPLRERGLLACGRGPGGGDDGQRSSIRRAEAHRQSEPQIGTIGWRHSSRLVERSGRSSCMTFERFNTVAYGRSLERIWLRATAGFLRPMPVRSSYRQRVLRSAGSRAARGLRCSHRGRASEAEELGQRDALVLLDRRHRGALVQSVPRRAMRETAQAPGRS